MPKLTIDEREIEVPDGLNLIEAARLAGIEIPHYCYHPALAVVGNCRMCLVEVEKAPKLQIACNTRVADGMVVRTRSERTKAAQRAVLEFLLINHPIDCPVCDQAGECKLQDYYMDYDRQPSRFELGRKNHKGKAIDIGAGLMLDQERCILCARCTRFFDEVTHTSELAIFGRGDHNVIDTYPGRKVDNAYALNVVDICPVGALTEQDFRFRMRVWYLHRTPSVCGECERGCAIDIHHHRGRIYRFKPRYNPAVNGYWMCDAGRHSFPALQGERRLSVPLKPAGERMAPVGWDAALDEAAAKIAEYRRAHGANAIGAIIGAHSTNEEAFALKRLMAALGSERLAGLSWSPPDAPADDDLLIRANRNPNTRGLAAMGIGADGAGRFAEAVAAGKLKMLVAMRVDLVRAMGEGEFVRHFGALGYLLVLDTDANETGEMSNLLLPVAAYPELDGSFTNFKGQVQRLTRAFDPPGQARPALEIIGALAERLERASMLSGAAADVCPKSADAAFAAMAAAEPAFAGMTLAALGEHGLPLRDS
ncbi:MAG TPA: molybdopterin-dependent oxidoreductase [Candidatus Binataceae bacterium]|nr:molybdopterin-dependent oxidoreductase [Candidatus Binataceae bacterium]